MLSETQIIIALGTIVVLVDRLRDRAASYLALVAVDEDGVLVHIAFSPVTMASPQPTLSALGLAPMALGTRQASGLSPAFGDRQ